ncbi:MAG TPA: acetyltransferase [Thermoanaerobaculia bacterium]
MGLDCRLSTPMVRALVILTLVSLNVALWGGLILLCGPIKLLTPVGARRRVILLLGWMGDRWARGNQWIFARFLSTTWEITGAEEFRKDARYLIISNHISWIDVFVVLRAFRDAPFIRFFLKRGLLWFPIAGQACWALEFPFMRRYSAEYLEKYPERRGLDLETTRIACQRYSRLPVSILNFVEGTRFSREKHETQDSPWKHLLRPRIGGIAFVLASLAEQLDALYDVTIIYPEGDVTVWRFVTNRVPLIRAEVRRIEIPAAFRSAAIIEAGPAREAFKTWFNTIWAEKDALIEAASDSR